MLDPISYKEARKVDEKLSLKHATLEKELNDFQSTLASVNINQEAKQSVTDYGIVTLPKNCSNGQVGATIKGETRTNFIRSSNMDKDSNGDGVVDDFTKWLPSDVTSDISFDSVKKAQKIDITGGTATTQTEINQFVAGITSSDIISGQVNVEIIGDVKVKLDLMYYNNTTFIGGTNAPPTSNSGIIKVENISPIAGTNKILFAIRVYPNAIGATGTVWVKNTVLEKATASKEYISSGTKSTVGAVRVRSESADKTQTSMLYLNAGQALRSLPNGIKDEVSEGTLVKRVEQVVLDASLEPVLKTSPSSTTVDLICFGGLPSKLPKQPIPFAGGIQSGINLVGYKQIAVKNWDGFTPGDIGTYFTHPEDAFGISIVVEKGRFVDTAAARNFINQNPPTLIYQLATPEVTDIQSSGSLFGYPSGTVYVEGVLPVAGIYEQTGITVTNTEFPIASLEKLSKIDPVTGVETDIPVASAVIAEDKLSFTHASLAAGDIVFFTYFHSVEGTVGETTISYYDSRYTIKDSATGKFYKWSVAVADGVPSIALVEV